MPEPRVVCWFSCGAASAIATKLALNAFDRSRVKVVYMDTHSEHPDNDRFLNECQEWFGHEIIRLSSDKYYDTWDVWEKNEWIGNWRGAPCTNHLKKEVGRKFMFYDDIQVFGYTLEEEARAKRFQENNPDYNLYLPLIDQKINKNDCYSLLSKAGIELPTMYKMGYNYNNCIACPKAGIGYWNKIRVDFPEVWERMAELEERLDVYLLAYKGSYSTRLRDIPPDAGNHSKEPKLECSIACSSIDDAILETNDEYVFSVPEGTLTYGSLFSGVGGLDLGLDSAGMVGRWQVEKNLANRRILSKHWPMVAQHRDIMNLKGFTLDPVDVIAFGFPCQDVSIVGQRAGMQGSETSLFFDAIRVIKEMREETNGAYPKYVIAENVTGLLSAESGYTFLSVLESLAKLGAVAIEWRVLDAQDFGLPQRRKRVFIVAHFDSGERGSRPIFPQPESLSRHSPKNRKPKREHSGGAASDPPIESLIRASDPIDPIRQAEDDPFAMAFSYRGGLGIQASTEVAPTFTVGSDGAAIYMSANGQYQLRQLTPEECERAQGWPVGHTQYNSRGFTVKDHKRYEVIGNGVAAPVAEWVARRIIQHHND